MKLIITKDYDHLSKVSATFVANQIKNKPDSTFCAPTGSTPIGMYANLVQMVKDKQLDFSHTKICNMDEYVGLEPSHTQSYNYFLSHHLLNHVDYDKENSVFVRALASDTTLECVRYSKALDALGVDIAVDGLGQNGHLAFNEPHDFLIAKTHVADLSENTIQANARFFDQLVDVPKQAYSIGIADLMMAKSLLILVNGAHKAQTIKRLFQDDTISTQFPASFLKMHPNCTMIIEQEAASLLSDSMLANCGFSLSVESLND